jgi:hypothetical protein
VVGDDDEFPDLVPVDRHGGEAVQHRPLVHEQEPELPEIGLDNEAM